MTSDEIYQLSGCRIFFGIFRNEATNKEIKKHQSFEEYWNEEMIYQGLGINVCAPKSDYWS